MTSRGPRRDRHLLGYSLYLPASSCVLANESFLFLIYLCYIPVHKMADHVSDCSSSNSHDRRRDDNGISTKQQLNTSTEFGLSLPEAIPTSVTIDSQSPSSNDEGTIISSQLGEEYQEEEDDQHPSISPATPAESLFGLSQLSTDQISAAALASSIHRTHSARSFRSEDFFSAHGSIDSDSVLFESPRDSYVAPSALAPSAQQPSNNIFGTDILVHINEDQEHSFSQPNDMMSMSLKKSTTTPSVAAKSVPPPSAADEEPHFDAATHVYSTVKNVWTWSRSLPVAGPILGLYEAAGVKILTTATKKDVTTLDSEITYHMDGLDKDIIDPAIAKILAIIWPGVEKVEDLVKTVGPNIPFVLYLFPMLKEDGESPETTTPVAFN